MLFNEPDAFSCVRCAFTWLYFSLDCERNPGWAMSLDAEQRSKQKKIDQLHGGPQL